VVGTGNFARRHIRNMLSQSRETTQIIAFVEVSGKQRDETRAIFDEFKLDCPPFYDSLESLVQAGDLPEVTLICSPHSFHKDHILQAFEAGSDVLVEKPMVLNVAEAEEVIRIRDRLGRLLSIAFPSSFSANIRNAKAMIAAGEIGEIVAINAFCHQQWKEGTVGKWRQVPEISGGGFLFDTGSHMVNAVIELAGTDIYELNAVLDQRGTPVEILSAVSGRFANGAMLTLCGAGDSVHCHSRVTVIGTKGLLMTGIWGEMLQIIRADNPEPQEVETPPYNGIWDYFLKVRAGTVPNPSPAEAGLRFARLMDLIRESAASGKPVTNPWIEK